jgi:hypothetical protein
VIRSSYLRVYQPLTCFSDEEQARWLAQAGDSETAVPASMTRWLLASSLPSLAAGGLTEGCFARRVGETLYVCPWRTRLRMLAGLLAFRGSVPQEVADAFVPEPEAERAARELAMMGERNPQIRSHILHANWHVPLRWFAAFDESERVLIEDRNGLRIRYETTLIEANERLERAIRILNDSPIDQSVCDAVRELSSWLKDFPENGLLELDYGGVAGAFEDDALVSDQSAAEVRACLDALESGDFLRAGEVFETLSLRWTEVRTLEVVN